MIAAPSTTECGPKTTTSEHAGTAKTSNLLRLKAAKSAEVDREFEAAVAASAGFPALLNVVKAWLPLRRIDAELEAVHTDLEERGAGAADISAVESLWHSAREATREAALRILDPVATDPRFAMAKATTFITVSGPSCPEVTDGDGNPNRLIRGLLLDAAADVPAGNAVQASEDDVALIALDAELASLLAETNKMQDELDVLVAQAHERAAAGWDGDKHSAEFFQRCCDFENALGTVAHADYIDTLRVRLAAIEKQGLGLRATTVEGLRFKARLAAHWHRFDPDHWENSSLIRDAALICGLPESAIDTNERDIFEEYELLGGKMTALENDQGDVWLGVRLAPPSTRSKEIEALLTRDMCRDLVPLARDAYGVQPWISGDGLVTLKPAGGDQ